MKKLTNKWAVFACLVSIALLFSCQPEIGKHGLGVVPTPQFTATVNSNGYSVSAVSTTKTPVMAYWTVSALGIDSLFADSLKVTFNFPGTYRIRMLEVSHAGTDTVSQLVTTTQINPHACDSTTVLGFLASCTQKTWQVIDSTGGFMVGPAAGSGSWWTAQTSDMNARPCSLNDTYTFVFPTLPSLNYAFIYDNGGDFYNNGYLDGGTDNNCQPNSNFTATNAPFGSGTFTYSVSSGTGAFKLGQITVKGLGAHLAMEGVDKTGDEDHHPPVSSITYDIVAMKHLADGDELVITIEYGPSYGGWWTFTLKEKK